jgi:integrase
VTRRRCSPLCAHRTEGYRRRRCARSWVAPASGPGLLGGAPIGSSTAALIDRLKKIAVLMPQPEVQIRGDGSARYEGVGRIIYACQRAGITGRGAHRLRHSLATEMLRAGASLPEVGQVLRHRSQLATTIYAKVDENALRVLARPWPGGDAA